MSEPGSSAENPRTESFLSFYVGEVLYALRHHALREILPLAPGLLPRRIRFEGEEFPTVDPRRLFGLGGPLPTERRVLLQRSGNRPCALIVDRVHDLLLVDRRRFQSVPWHFGGREQLWFEGIAALDAHRPLVLLRPQGLLASYGALEAGRREAEP